MTFPILLLKMLFFINYVGIQNNHRVKKHTFFIFLITHRITHRSISRFRIDVDSEHSVYYWRERNRYIKLVINSDIIVKYHQILTRYAGAKCYEDDGCHRVLDAQGAAEVGGHVANNGGDQTDADDWYDEADVATADVFNEKGIDETTCTANNITMLKIYLNKDHK